MVFLPNPGRRTHENAKDFRSINLTSFLLKVLERLMDIHIRSIEADNLPTAQHAYIIGRSTETCLYEVINVIEKSLHFKQYTMSAFLVIEGAFNNKVSSTVIESLQHGGIGDMVCKWVQSILINRTIKVINGSVTGTS